jgi:cell volume regulation protein A
LTASILIALSILILLSYVFDITSSRTKIPSVLLLLALGWGTKELTLLFNINIPNLNSLLPLFGTVGLILIVLEGTLELEINKTKLPLLSKSFFAAVIPIIIFSAIFAAVIYYLTGNDIKNCIVNAIPLSVISSAIAIPSVRNLAEKTREFIIYESSISDIAGVSLFYFFVLNNTIDAGALGIFFLQIIIITIISFLATSVLALLLSRLKQHVKFVPIIFIIILIYAIAKDFHLPSLIFIMILGLFLGNLKQLPSNRFIDFLKPEILDREVTKFKELTAEATFLVRTIFFILFGYEIKLSEVLSTDSIYLTMLALGIAFLIRALQLGISKMKIFPKIFIAPRGLINILLFISIPASQKIGIVNNALMIQIILATSIIMTVGMMFSKKENSLLKNKEA